MTVTSTNQKVQFNGTGSTTVFAYNFKIFAQTDLSVILRSAAGTETVQQTPSNYTVSGVGAASGGNVTMGVAPPSGTTLTILRVQPNLQGLDLVPNDPFPAGSMEDALDKLTFMVQTHDEEIRRSIKASPTNVIADSEFTVSATDRANKLFSFDASGNLSIAQELGTYRGNWAASTAYAVRDLVKDTSTGNIFIVITAHTSSGSQPITTNTDAAKWALIVDAASATTSKNAAAASAVLASQWAIKTDATVDGTNYSAKYWATRADVGAVAGKAAEIGRLGTSDAVADLAILGTSAAVADMAILGTSAVVADMAILGTSDVVADMNTLGTSDVVSDMNTLGTSDVVSDMNLLATSANVSAMGKLGIDAVIADMALLGTSAVVADMDILSATDVVSDMNLLGTSANVTAMGVLGTSANVTAMAAIAGSSSVEIPALTVKAGDGADGNFFLIADNSDDNGDDWLITAKNDPEKTLQILNNSGISGGVILTLTNSTNLTSGSSAAFAGTVGVGNSVKFENSINGSYSGSVTVKSGNSSNTVRTITLPDLSGTVALTSQLSGPGFQLPTAAASTLGGIKVGTNLSIDSSGVLSSTSTTDVVSDTSPQLGGNLDVNGKDIVSTSNGAIELDPNGSGKVVFKGNATKGAGQFVLNCPQNSHGITIKGPPHSASANYTLTLPNTDGSANQVLKTDGSGNLDWVAQSVADGAVTTAKIADSAVTTAKINADAVTNAKLADNSVDSEQYVDGSIDTAHIADSQITVAKMAANSVDSDQYVDGSIDTAHIADAQITTAKINADAITNAKMADNSVDSDQYVDGSIDTAHIADSQITVAKMAANSVDSAQYVDGSIDTAHIADANVTQAKIAAQAINESKLQVSNAPTNGYFLSAQSGNTGGLTWAAAASGGGGATLIYENESDGNSVSAIDHTSSAGSNLCGFDIFLTGLRPNSSSKLVVEPLDASGNQIGVTNERLGYQYSSLYAGGETYGHSGINGRDAIAHFRNNVGAAHGSAADYSGATGTIRISWSRAEDRRKWQMFCTIGYPAGDGRNYNVVDQLLCYSSHNGAESLTADLGGFRLRNSNSSTFQAGSVRVTDLVAG